MPDVTQTSETPTPLTPGRGAGEQRSISQVLVVVVGALVGVLIIIAFALLLFDGDPVETTDTSATSGLSTTSIASSTTGSSTTTTPPTTGSSTTQTPTTSSTASPTTTATSPPPTGPTSQTVTPSTVDPPGAYVSAVWPWPGSTLRYTDPVEAATGFAVDFVGFTDPAVGEFQQGDSRSGEVEIRPSADGPITVVFVRQLGSDDTWWVLGSATANITVNRPSAMTAIESPQIVTGTALAFEGHIDVALRADGAQEPVATTFVTGGGAEPDAFFGTIEWVDSGATGGALVFTTSVADDGRVWEASVVRVLFVPE